MSSRRRYFKNLTAFDYLDQLFTKYGLSILYTHFLLKKTNNSMFFAENIVL